MMSGSRLLQGLALGLGIGIGLAGCGTSGPSSQQTLQGHSRVSTHGFTVQQVDWCTQRQMRCQEYYTRAYPNIYASYNMPNACARIYEDCMFGGGGDGGGGVDTGTPGGGIFFERAGGGARGARRR